MAFAPKTLLRSTGSSSLGACRCASTSSSSSKAQITAALLLSRQPLLTPTPHPLESAYFAHTQSIRVAISNPIPSNFYFKPGSLPLRRFQRAQHIREVETFGPRLAGKTPDVGDVPDENPYEEISRDHWEKEDLTRGEKSLERFPTEEVFCLIEDESSGKWKFPFTNVAKDEGLDEAVRRGLIGVEGKLDGESMDSWLVTRKPVGMSSGGDGKIFYLRSHILAGEPKLDKSTGWSNHAWLSAKEVEERLRKQGDEKVWEDVKGMFGIAEEVSEEA